MSVKVARHRIRSLGLWRTGSGRSCFSCRRDASRRIKLSQRQRRGSQLPGATLTLDLCDRCIGTLTRGLKRTDFPRRKRARAE